MIIRLPFLASYDWPATLAFLGHRAIDGVEEVESGVYRRTIRCDGLTGTLDVAHDDVGAALVVTVRGEAAGGVQPPGPPEDGPRVLRPVRRGAERGGENGPVGAAFRRPGDLPDAVHQTAVERVRHMFDLDADLRTITAHLARDPSMAPLVAARPALRVLRGWDGFEVAARSVIGQQVTVARARHLNGILVDRCGSDLPGASGNGLRRIFPTAAQVLAADLSAMGMPGARAATLKTIAGAALAEPRLFDRAASIDETVARLRAIRGIGDWTAHYIAMRACGEADAFPASDVGLLRGAADATNRRPTAGELLARAEAWRPWRAYAAHQLWARDSAKG